MTQAVADAGGDPGVQRNNPFKLEKNKYIYIYIYNYILFYTCNNEIPACSSP